MTDTFEFVLISGLSGSGQTEAMRCFEDMGYFTMDNLPPSVIEQVAELCRGSSIRRAAVVVRPGGGEFFDEFFSKVGQALHRIRGRGIKFRIMFLDASDDAIVRRFDEKRRPHPLAPASRVQDGIAAERELVGALRDDADIVIDTSALTPHELRDRIQAAFPTDEGVVPGLNVSIVSFGFKYGLPTDADMVFDTRFLPNPHWIAELRPLSGVDGQVNDYVFSHDEAKRYLNQIQEMLAFLVPAFVREGKHYLTIAIGCTGGRHRSVTFAEAIGGYLEKAGHPARVTHRDLERE